MIALLPVSRYRVRYQVASGRPYSFFDRFVLEAITAGQSSLGALEAQLRVHRRALIETIVTLMQAGWVAIDRHSHQLVPTLAGRKAAEHPDDLPKNIVVVELTDFVLGERVEGQLAKGTDVTFSPRAAIRSHLQQSAVLPPSDLPHPLDPGLLIPFLRVGEGEWIRSCGPVDVIRDGADFVVVDVDTASGAITGIPSKWLPLLRDHLIDRARAKERRLIEQGLILSTDSAIAKLVRRATTLPPDVVTPDPDEWTLDPTLDHFIVGSDAHDGLLEHWLETARSYVGILSTKLDERTVKRLQPALRSAVARGVLIDVMWGTEPDAPETAAHERAFDALRRIEADAQHASVQGRLTLGRKAAGSHSKILIGDVGEGFEAVVGSYDWLAEGRGRATTDLSLYFREPGPVARIAHLVADLAAADPRLSTGRGLTRLRHAAAEIGQRIAETAERARLEREDASLGERTTESQPTEPSVRGSLRARLVIGRQHHAILPTIAEQASRRVVVACHRWGEYSEAAFRPLREALERGCEAVEIRYCEDTAPGPSHDALTADLAKLGGSVREIVDFHARIAVTDDDTAVVTSFDWLCPYEDRRRALASDIGFVLRGSGIGSDLLARVRIYPDAVAAPIPATYIAGFRIERLRSVNHLDWRLAEGGVAGWHVLVGDNGSGKTSTLRALALVLVGSVNAHALRQDWSTWLRGESINGLVEVALDESVDASSQTNHRVVKMAFERTGDSTTIRSEPEEHVDVASAAYGPFRRFTGGDPDYEKQLGANPVLARHMSLFDERVALTESLSWLRALRFKALENDAEATLLLDRLSKLVNASGLLPHGIRLAEITSSRVSFRDEYGFEYGIDELSDGYRSVLSLTFDMVRQFAMQFGPARIFSSEQHEIVTAPAIVLIDEVDAHLHPEWQRTIGQWFRKHFPRVQFIVTTHSPLVCQAAENGTVYRLPDPIDEDDSGEMLDGTARARLVYGNVLEAYASGAFGDGVTRSESSKSLLHRLAELNRKELGGDLSDGERDEQQKLRSALPLAAHTIERGVPDGD